MSKIYTSVTELIGRTPLIELVNIEKKYDLKAKVVAKLELFNPAGSVKDRVAKAMVEDAEKSGKLKKGSTIIEPTSGNTGIGLARSENTSRWSMNFFAVSASPLISNVKIEPAPFGKYFL